MIKLITLKIDAPILDADSTKIHYATSYEIRNKPVVNDDTTILHLTDRDTVNLLISRVELDLKLGDVIYARTRYHFKDTVTGEVTDDNFSRFVSFRSDQEGFTLSDIIVSTPTVILTRSPLMDGTFNFEARTSDFKMYAGIGSHKSTSWAITDTDGNIIIFRDRDETNLLSFKFNSKILDADKNYILSAIHTTETGGVSLKGKLNFTLHIKEAKLYDIKQIGAMVTNRLLYFKLMLYTAMFDTIDIIVKDRYGNIVAQGMNQKTVVPSVAIGELTPYDTYTVYARIKLKNSYVTPYRLVSTNVLEENFLVLPKDNLNYLGKFDYTQELLLNGQTVQATSEFYNGAIILSKHDSKSLFRYRIYGDKLVEIGKLVDIETANDSNIGIPYLNVLPMHSGKFTVNYCYDNAGGDEAYSVFNVYSYNASSNKVTLLGKLVNKDELYSTALSGSAVVDRDDNVYYIPAKSIDANGAEQPLALYKFNTTTFTRDKVADLPFTAIENVSLAITRNNNLVVIGGTGGTGISTEYDGIKTFRTNHNIYVFNTISKTFSKIGDISALPYTMYRFQSFLRRDGKIVVFNAVPDYVSVGDQRTFVINTADSSITINNNDMPDNLVYRNSLVLRSGDILRISNRELDPQVVYRYISDTMGEAAIDTNTVITSNIKDLVIGYKEIITVEEPWLYDSITILGTTEADTGILRWVQDEETIEYNYKTLLVTRDDTIGTDIISSKKYSEVVIIGNSSMVATYAEPENILIVPMYETVTIFDPYQYTKIIVEGTSMEDTGTLIWEDKYITTSFYYDTLWVTRSDKLVADTVNAAEYTNVMNLDMTHSVYM